MSRQLHDTVEKLGVFSERMVVGRTSTLSTILKLFIRSIITYLKPIVGGTQQNHRIKEPLVCTHSLGDYSVFQSSYAMATTGAACLSEHERSLPLGGQLV